jgi:hypothetical protein
VSRRRALGLLLGIGLISLYAIGYDTIDSWVYLVAFMPLPALALGLGMQWANDHGAPVGVAWLLPLALLVLNWGHINVRNQGEAVAWLDMAVDRLPAHAIVLTSADHHTFALWYATEARGQRPDLLVIDQRLWATEPYRRYLSGDEAQILDPADLGPERPLCVIHVDDEVACE